LVALELGAADYLTKTFDPEELVLRVHNVLGRSQGGGTGESGSTENDIIEFDGWQVNIAGRSVSGSVGLRPGCSLDQRRI
jgi:two-component system OmpR family response regulator